MGNAGRNGGGITIPRPLIKPLLRLWLRDRNTIYDGAVGSAGFLCEAFDYLMNSKNY
jgi:type I restriction enzyme M protein